MSELVLGIDIGGTNTKIGLTELGKGEVYESSFFSTKDCPDFPKYLSTLKKEVSEYCRKLDIDIESSNIPMGFGVPNYSDSMGEVITPPNLNWGTVNFLSQIQDTFQGHPIRAGNDANVAACAEKFYGAARDYSNFMVVTVGTGIGSGIFMNNQLVTGSSGLASELGHIQISGDGRVCGCGGIDHLESYCSVTGIKKTLLVDFGLEASFAQIIEEFGKIDDCDKRVIDGLRKTAKYFAQGLSNANLLLSLEGIFLAGGGMNLGERFLIFIKDELRQLPFYSLNKTTDIKISTVSTKSGAILGAASLFHL